MRKSVAAMFEQRQLLSQKGQAGLFLLLFLLVQLLYWPAARAGFITDYTGLMERLDGAPFSDFLGSFGFPALHAVTNFFLYWFHKFFGVNGLGWHLVHTLLHALNAWMVFRLSAKIFEMAGMKRSMLPAFLTTLLFLAHPYNAEPVIWRVCFNHLFTSFLILSSLWLALRFFDEKKNALLWWVHGIFAVALFSFETALVLPPLLVLLAFLYPQWLHLRQWVLLLLPQFLLVAIWAGLNHYLFGSIVGHYGASVHLRFYPPEIASTLTKYFLKYLLFWRHWPHHWKESLMQHLDNPTLGWILFIAGIGVALLALLILLKIKPSKRLPLLASGAFFVSLLPVSNLYVSWILFSENDRYGYLASFFFTLALVSSLTQWRWKFWSKMLVLITFLFFAGTWEQVKLWEQNNAVQQAVLNTWKWNEAPEIYLLAYPENYQGTPMFRDFSGKDEALLKSLNYLVKKHPRGHIYEVAQFNLTKADDGVHVELSSKNVFLCQFSQWGNWWWRRGIGTWNYETPKYRFTVDGNGSMVELLNPAPGAVALWWDGYQWQQADL